MWDVQRVSGLPEGLWCPHQACIYQELLQPFGGTLLTYTEFPPGILSAWKVPHVLPTRTQGSNFAARENIWRDVLVY